jgi:hypothetical protein
MPKLPIHPAHPERVCWGCDEYCPADDLTCGKDTVRTPHPNELFSEDWHEARESGADTRSARAEPRSADQRASARGDSKIVQ